MKGTKNPYSGRNFRRALRWFVVGRAAQAVATLTFTLLAVRVLGAADYGAYMVLWGLIELARPLSSLGLLPALQQFLPEMALHADRNQLFRFVRWTTVARFSLLSAFALGFYVFWVPLSGWLGFTAVQQTGTWLVCLMIVTVHGASFTDQMLESLLEQRFAQAVRALFPLLRLAGLLALLLTGRVTLVNMLWVDALVSALCLALAEWSLLRQLKGLRPDGSKTFTWQEIGTYIWHLSGAQLLNAVANPGTLRILVSRLLGLEVAGQFAFLQQLIMQFNRFLPSVLLANLVRPMLIARQVQGDSDSVATGTGVLWKLNIALVWPGVALMLVAGDPVMSMLSGGRLAGAGLAMAWMVFGAASIAQSQIVAIAMQVYRYSALVRTTSLAGLAAPLFVWAASHLGLAGTCAGFALALWLRGAIGLTLLQRCERRIALDLRGAFRLLSALVAATAAAWVAAHWLQPLVAVAVLLVVYLGALLVAKPLTLSEFNLLERALGARVGGLRFMTSRN